MADNAEQQFKEKYGDINGPSNQTEIDIIMAAKKAVEKSVETMLKFTLNEKPLIERKPVIDWQGRMRVVKPADCAFVSIITLRRQKAQILHFSVHGFFTIYIPEDTADTILRGLGMTGPVTDDDIRDGCGEFLNIIAGLFKRFLVSMGYEELEISLPHNFGFHVDELIDFKEPFKFEIVFMHEGKKFLHVDIGTEKMKKVG